MDAVFVGQLIDSMSDALAKLEKVVNNKKKREEATKLKTLIIDLYRQINDSLLEKNV